MKASGPNLTVKTALQALIRPLLLASIVVLIASIVLIVVVLATTGDVLDATIMGGRVALFGILLGIVGALAGAITTPASDPSAR